MTKPIGTQDYLDSGLRHTTAATPFSAVEFRRNEVQLSLHPADEADIAVGLDDLQDALEGVISRG